MVAPAFKITQQEKTGPSVGVDGTINIQCMRSNIVAVTKAAFRLQADLSPIRLFHKSDFQG